MAESTLNGASVRLHVICHRPGLIRAGQRHAPHAAYDGGAWSEAQLAELAAEPAITLVVGHVPQPADLAGWSVAPEARETGNAPEARETGNAPEAREAGNAPDEHGAVKKARK